MHKFVCQLSIVLVLIGAINWGLIGLNPTWNAVEKVTNAIVTDSDSRETVNRTVYILVGLAALFLILKKLSTKRN